MIDILKELNDWSAEFDKKQMGSKAFGVYVKCKRRGKHILAAKIEEKYKRYFPKSDLAMSFTMLLMAQKNAAK